ncbi:transposase [Pontibacter actiniarum]
MLGRKRIWPLRSILNAIFYVSKGGIQWRMMPRFCFSVHR